jgi:cyanophycin synthetase
VGQPAVVLTFTLPSPSVLDFEALDCWLADTFTSQGLQWNVPMPRVDNERARVESLAQRVVWMATAVQQAGRLPIFDCGKLLGLTPDPTTPAAWRVRILAANVDLVPLKTLGMAYTAAVNAISLALQHRMDADALESVLKDLDEQCIQRLRTMGLAGISTMPILREAHAQGIVFRHLEGGVFQLGWGANARQINRSILDTDSCIGAQVAGKKHWTAQFLRSAGLPAPVHERVQSEAQAVQAASKLGWPVVVKPADRERSEGVTIAINTEQELLEAFRQAAALSKAILVEREVPGVCYRLMVAHGEFLYAVRRRPRSVTADGVSNVEGLITAAHAQLQKLPPWSRSKLILLDPLTLKSLETQGLGPESVPLQGTVVALRQIESSQWGGDVDDATADVHPENSKMAVQAARLLGLGNAGVDVISLDISRPWYENGAVLNEVNFAPHFGGTEAARKKMPVFLHKLMGGNGRIPVEIYIGGALAWEAALLRHGEWATTGVRCYLTSHVCTFDSRKDRVHFTVDGLFNRSMALLMNREVQALVLVVQTDELLFTGLPVDQVTRVQVFDADLMHWQNGTQKVGADQSHKLMQLFAPERGHK